MKTFGRWTIGCTVLAVAVLLSPEECLLGGAYPNSSDDLEQMEQDVLDAIDYLDTLS